MSLAPIALFGYNRPDHLKRTYEALRRNNLASDSELYVFLDGAKPGQETKVKEVRSLVSQFSGFKSINITESLENKGLAGSIVKGVTQVIQEHGKIIVLEDDLETSPHFLQFMNDALDLYEDKDHLACISGYFYPHKPIGTDTFLIKGADCWGWATWSKSWDLFEDNGQQLLDQIRDRKLEDEFNFNKSMNYTGMLKDAINKKNSSWAIKWYASAFLNDKYTLYPDISFVNNIGNDSSGSHSGTTSNFDVLLSQKPLKLEAVLTEESIKGRKAVETFFKKKPKVIRIVQKIKSWLLQFFS